MYIIQMADLHIGSLEETKPTEEEFIRKSVELIKEKIPEKEEVLLFLCGDIIDSKDLENDKPEVQKRYKSAKELIDILKHLLEDYYTLTIKCCPGNHDITHMDEFYQFVESVDNLDRSKKQLKSCYTYESKGSNFIFVNSCKGDQYTVGCIDYDELERELNTLPREESKMLILHHTIMSMFDKDPSPIRNAARLVKIIDKYNISTVLHGHIHGRDILMLGQNQCKLIGVGALFSRNNANVNSQFNIIKYNNDIVTEILNCRYNADGGSDEWDVHDLADKEYENIFRGESFGDVYRQLINKLGAITPLYNVVLKISNDYEKFSNDLEKYFENEVLKIGDKEYDYFDLAKMWEADDVPEELYFNHGSYFKVNELTGIDFVKKKLNQKSTSNRIILSTYNMKELVQSFDDNGYLPSLESIQFGKIDEEGKLLVHMHLRALEANWFLKINICEIAYILTELKKGTDAIDFNKVDISISAFRVQKKERFNCFLKAEIDKLPEPKLGAKVSHGKIEELCKLLEEKRDGMETITKVRGVEAVYEAMKASNEEADDMSSIRYDDEILRIFEEVLDVYKELSNIHDRTSISSQQEKECEMKIDTLLGDVIQKLKELQSKRKENVG